MKDLKKLVRLTEKRVQNITAQEIADIFPVLTDLESAILSKEIRNNEKLIPLEYYANIGRTIEMIVYRVTQERMIKEVKNENA